MLRLLYNLSAEEEARKAIGATDTPRIVMKHVLTSNEPQLPLELAALAINLAADPAGATAMADNGDAVRQLVDKLYQSHDLHPKRQFSWCRARSCCLRLIVKRLLPLSLCLVVSTDTGHKGASKKKNGFGGR